MALSPDLAERVSEIVEQALEVSESERPAIVRQLCREDAALCREVESLLGFSKRARDFIEKPAYTLTGAAGAITEGGIAPGESIAQYRIVSLIGEGGMGEVYLAEDTDLKRPVAIKLLKFGLGTASIIRHFHHEERILAGLNHPSIARLYGGGVTEKGLPYFVMEYVEGVRLDDYVRERHLSVRQKLELFRKICSAVSYAHQRLVVHRDLKPANIRVAAEGEPKLLDFGIAKLVDPELASEQTMTMASIMTPEYASPEQVRCETITTASDVYSLGVVFYEMLTEHKPYKIEQRSPTGVARAITDQNPTRPSSRLTLRASRKSVRGDLDNIVLKALRKEPERRYVSVAALAEDIRRHLEGRPVSARQDSVGYRTSKFIRRNKIAVGAAALILVAIVGGSIAALWEASRANHQRDLAERERLKEERVNAFLQDMLGAAAPEKKGIDVKVVDLLSDASTRAQTEMTNEPGVMADVLTSLGRTYISLSLFGEAEKDLRAAVAASLKGNGEQSASTAIAMGWLGLALGYRDKAVEGEAISRKAVALHKQLHPEGDTDFAVALYSLGLNLSWQGKSTAAEPVLQQALDMLGKNLGENNGYYMAALTSLAIVRGQLGKGDDAEKLYRRAIEIGAHVEKRYRIYLAQATGYLGEYLTTKGSYREAESNLRQSLGIYREIMAGDDNVNVATIERDLGRVHFLEGEYGVAATEYRKSLDQLARSYPAEHPLPLGVKVSLGLTLSRLGRAAEGEPLLRDALEVRQRVLPPDSVMIPLTQSALGECLFTQNRLAEAKPLLLSGYDGLRTKLNAADPRVVEARQRVEKLTSSK